MQNNRVQDIGNQRQRLPEKMKCAPFLIRVHANLCHVAIYAMALTVAIIAGHFTNVTRLESIENVTILTQALADWQSQAWSDFKLFNQECPNGYETISLSYSSIEQ